MAAAEPATASEPDAAMQMGEMQMGDREQFGRLLIDQLEWHHDGSADAGAWEVEGWYGGDRDKVWIRTEGEHSGADTRNARGELLWDHAIGAWWNLQSGLREDFGGGPARTWAALGVEGLAPYWLSLEATLYLGEAGRTAARLRGEYEILLTQRLILQPEAELNLYGKRDAARQLASGLADAEAGLRLRYEIRRELAPYIGVAWTREKRLGFLAASGAQFVAGVRAWF